MRTYKATALYQTLQKELTSRQSKAYGTLALSVITASFFAVFAIRPTILTITSLRRQVSDFQSVDRKIREKIDVLSRLSFTYRSLEPNLPTIKTAVPEKTNLAKVITVLIEVGNDSGAKLDRLSINDLTLTSVAPETTPKFIKPQLETVSFTANYTGPYQSLLQILENFNRLDRLILIDQSSLKAEGTKTRVVSLEIKGRAFSLSLN